VVGINLLREGGYIPEGRGGAILDEDKEGLLRSQTRRNPKHRPRGPATSPAKQFLYADIMSRLDQVAIARNQPPPRHPAESTNEREQHPNRPSIIKAIDQDYE